MSLPRFKWITGGGAVAQLWSVQPCIEQHHGFVCQDEAGIYWWHLGAGRGNPGSHERATSVKEAKAALLAFVLERDFGQAPARAGQQLELFDEAAA